MLSMDNLSCFEDMQIYEENIGDVKRHLVLHYKTKTTSLTKKGDPRGYGTVWFNTDGIANIFP